VEVTERLMVIAGIEQIIDKLTNLQISYTMIPRDEGGVILEVGRFGYFFNKRGRVSGGYILQCMDYRYDWLEWGQLMGSTLRFEDDE
jgi:hypothetical protein